MSNENSFRRKNSKGAKLIEEQKPQRDALSAAQDVQSELSTLNQVSTEQLDALGRIQSSLDNQEAASELSLEELNTISEAMKKLQDASRSGPSASQLSDLQNTIEIASDIRSEEHKETLQGFNDVQAALKALQNDPSLKQVEFKAPQGFQAAPKVTPVINPSLPEPEPIKEDKASEMLPKDKEKEKERGQASAIAAVLSQLKQMNSTMTGMAGGISQMVFQMGLQTIKMGALVGAGLFAADVILAGVKSIWDKYGEQIKAVMTDIGTKLSEGWDKLKGILPIEEFKRVFSNLNNLFQDFQNGELIDGIVYTIKDQLQNLMSVVSRVMEGILRAVGKDDWADAMVHDRVQKNTDRGVASSAADNNIYAKVEAEKNEERAKQIKYEDVQKEMLADPQYAKYKVKSKFGYDSFNQEGGNLVRQELEKRRTEIKGRTKEQILASQMDGSNLAVGSLRDSFSGYDDEDRSEGRYNRLDKSIKLADKALESSTITEKQREEIIRERDKAANMQKTIRSNQEAHQAERDEIEGRTPSIRNDSSSANNAVNKEINDINKLNKASENAKNDALTNSIMATNVSNVKNSTMVVMNPISSMPGISITA